MSYRPLHKKSLTKTLLLALLVFLGPFFASGALAEPLWYTVQGGSYRTQTEAEQFYNTLAKVLPIGMRDHLRIELVSNYFTVRAGKFQTSQEAEPLRAAIDQQTPAKPIILHAYIRPARIKKSLQPVAKSQGEPIPPPVTQEPIASAPGPIEELPLPEEPKKEIAKPQAPSQPRAETVAPKPQKTPPPEPEPQPAPKPKSLATVTPADLEQMKSQLLAKYLDQGQTQEQKRAQVLERNNSYAANQECVSECHQELTDRSIVHAPAASGRCQACHQQQGTSHPAEGTAGFSLAAEGAALCQQCHSARQDDYQHSPAAEGECLLCHDPHGSANPALLPVQANEQKKLCLECHDGAMFDKTYNHGPADLGTCSYCHDPHGSRHDKLLKAAAQDLCLSCHSYFAERQRNAAHQHSIVKEEGCMSCHQPHASDNLFLLNRDHDQFCISCHQAIDDLIKKSTIKHSGLFLDKQCGTCHLAHFSDFPALLVKKQADLCFTCHGAENPLPSYKPKNVATELEEKEFIHQPVMAGECSSCHNPHGTRAARLLVGNYPASFYAAYASDAYDLCFTCHDKELMTNEEATTETDFRNGATNLHYTHVVIERKGRTCGACHQAHASDGPKLINQSGATFGAWQMSIQFTLGTSGGSCIPGCHREMGYDRETPVDYTVEESDFEPYYINYEGK